MIIAVYSRIKIDRILLYAKWGSCGLAGGALIWGLLALCFSPWQREGEMLGYHQNSVQKLSEKPFSYSAIGSGCLSLRCAAFCPFAMRLKEEVMILAQNTRPDIERKDAELLVQLKSVNEKQTVTSGTLLYLIEDGQQVRFSLEPTDFWVRPVLTEGGDLLLEAEKSGEKGKWLVKANQELGKRVGERFWDNGGPLFVQTLKGAKFFGIDLLVQHYSGKEHQFLQGKYKFFVGDQVYFVAQGDYLVWKENHWETSSAPLHDSPLAQVKAVSAKGIEIEVWDETGFQMYSFKFEGAASSKMGSGHSDQVPTTIRLRTSSQVACTLGKRRIILKEGDWLVRAGTGWRKLKTPAEVDDCLFHRIRGELLIFDKLEKLPGKTILHAHLFDEMRTQVQTLAIPIAAEKKKTSGGKL